MSSLVLTEAWAMSLKGSFCCSWHTVPQLLVYTHINAHDYSKIPHTLDRTSRPRAQLVVWGTWRGTPWGRAHSRAPGPRGGTTSSRSHSCRPAVQHQQGLWWVLAASHSKRDHVLVLTGMQAKETQSWGRSKSGQRLEKPSRHAKHWQKAHRSYHPKHRLTLLHTDCCFMNLP